MENKRIPFAEPVKEKLKIAQSNKKKSTKCAGMKLRAFALRNYSEGYK